MNSPNLVFDNFQKAIADSPHLGFADMRNLDIFSKPGAVTLNFLSQMVTPSPKSFTFTADAATNVLTLIGTSGSNNFQWNGGISTRRAITVSNSGGALPAGLAASTVYFIIGITSSTIKLATSITNADAGTAIDITDAGTGTHTITSVDIGLIKFFAKDSRTSITYGQDHNGRIWYSYSSGGNDWYLLPGNTLTNANAQGLAIYKNHLLAFRSAKIDIYGDLSAAEASRAWNNDWQTMSQTAGGFTHHYTVVGQDDILYFSDVNITTGIPYIGSIEALVAGAPPTATYNATALDLPAYKTITHLDELGKNLMIGTMGREIYPWDRSSGSVDLPIIAAEDGIKTMRTLNNTLYFAAGTRGNIYKTVGSYTTLVRRLPTSITGFPYNSVNIGDMVGHKGRLFFTVECKLASGVYSIELETGRLMFEHRITTAPIDAATSTGTYGTSNPLTLSSLYSNGGESLLFGWKDNDNTLYGINNTGYSSYYFYPSYAGYFDSELKPTGTAQIPKTYTNLLIDLDTLLASGQGVKVYYRKNLTDSFTLIATFDYATYGTVSNIMLPANIVDTNYVQIRAELTVAASATAAPELRSIILN